MFNFLRLFSEAKAILYFGRLVHIRPGVVILSIVNSFWVTTEFSDNRNEQFDFAMTSER